MKKSETLQPPTQNFARIQADVHTGLNDDQVAQRIAANAHNQQPKSLTPTVGQIIRHNVFTLFNLINLLLAAAIIAVGHWENAFFLGVAICNTLMGIFQEVRAKRTLDKLSILAQTTTTVIRNGQKVELGQEEVVLDDILFLASGKQICADSVVVEAEGLEVDESLLTGEGNNIPKQPGSKVLSGSFVTAGTAYVRVNAVGAGNFATALTIEAKKTKAPKSQLMATLNHIIRALTITIVPVGALLFSRLFITSGNIRSSVLGATAAMLGMIPEGLILLTGVTLTVGALALARHKALVQSLSSIETLARVDVLCLDKTGTITDGTLSFEQFIPQKGYTEDDAKKATGMLMAALEDTNATATALRAIFSAPASLPAVNAHIPFSSARKWSGASFAEEGSYILGAPSFVFTGQPPAFMAEATKFAAEGYRVLCLAHSKNILTGEQLPDDLRCVALVLLSDTIRKEAPDTFRFFEKEGVLLKVISGDDPATVSTIAAKAGLDGAEKWVDMSQFGEEDDFTKIVEEYVVFGRVSPRQKKELIAALKKNGHTTCMTGDGVNDVLAMKESDCSVAMINGSDAARSACDFVLMTSDFSSMVHVLQEGRRVINNIEAVASMYLVKTIYSTLLAVIYIFLPFPYPFAPLQMMPINSFTVAIPSFFLSLRRNFRRPSGRFIINVLENALPAALTVVFNILFIQLAGVWFGLSHQETSTINVLLTGMVGFILLVRISRPHTFKIKLLVAGCVVVFLAIMLFLAPYIMLGSLFTRNVLFYAPLLYTSVALFRFINSLVQKGEAFAEKWRLRRISEKATP